MFDEVAAGEAARTSHKNGTHDREPYCVW
jgi:hypothetical protein